MESQIIISKGEPATLQTTWKIYQSQWKTFLALVGIYTLVNVVYFLLDSLLSLFGIAPSFSDPSYYSTASLLGSYLFRVPLYLIYLYLISILGVLFGVVPALYFDKGEVITWKVPYQFISEKLLRFTLGGILFTFALTLGYLFCIIPGILISFFITPVFINKLTTTDLPILKAFVSSFQSVFKYINNDKFSYFILVFLASIISFIAMVCSCFVGWIITLPMYYIYIFHLGYNKGILN